MTSADIAALRAQACELIAILGEALDALQTIEEIAVNPSDPEQDATAISMQLNQAAAAAELLAGGADEFCAGLDRHYTELCPSAAEMEGV